MAKNNWENWVADNEIPDVEVDVKAEQRANFLRSAGLVAAGATGGVLAYLGISHLINAEKAKNGELVPGVNDEEETEEASDSETTESNEGENEEVSAEPKSEPVTSLIPVDDKIPEGIREALKAMGIDKVDASILAMLEATYQTAVKAESAAVAEEINQLTSLVDKTKADFQKVVDEITAASAADKKASEAKIKELEAANKKLEAAKADAEAKAKEPIKAEEKKSEDKPTEEKSVIALPEATQKKEEAEARPVETTEEETVDETPSILDALERMQQRDQSKSSKKSKSGKKAKKSKK